jgi:hypothetical protein
MTEMIRNTARNNAYDLGVYPFDPIRVPVESQSTIGCAWS